MNISFVTFVFLFSFAHAIMISHEEKRNFSIIYLNPSLDGVQDVTITMTDDNIIFYGCNLNEGKYHAKGEMFEAPKFWMQTRMYCQKDHDSKIRNAFGKSNKMRVSQNTIEFQNDESQKQIILRKQNN